MDIDPHKAEINLTTEEMTLLLLDKNRSPWQLDNAMALYDITARSMEHYAHLEDATSPNIKQRAAARAAGQVATQRLALMQSELAPYIDGSNTGDQAEQFLRENNS